VIDRTPPDTTITGGPSGNSNSSPTFTYTSSEAGSTFECNLDASPTWQQCNGGSKSYSHLAPGLHTFYVRATDGAGNTDPSPASRTFTVEVNPGGPYSGDEGSSVSISGTVASGVTVTWSYTAGPLVDAGATCTFASATSPSTTVKCTDDGTFTLTMTASDGTSETTTLTLSNVAPTNVKITSPLTGTKYQHGTTVAISSSFGDPGSNDKHTCVITWNYGQSPAVTSGGSVSEAAGTGKCQGSHLFSTAGTYSIAVTVLDDDGGSTTSPPITITIT
jgi:hypothetical protein